MKPIMPPNVWGIFAGLNFCRTVRVVIWLYGVNGCFLAMPGQLRLCNTGLGLRLAAMSNTPTRPDRLDLVSGVRPVSDAGPDCGC